MKTLLAFIGTACIHFSLYGQSLPPFIGSRSLALGTTTACLQDEWSLFNNPAGLSGIKHTTAAFTYEAVPDFSPFNRTAALIAAPSSYGTFGFGMYRFGDDLYNEQIARAGFSNRFGLASLGVTANYVQYNVAGFGRKGFFTVGFGGMAMLTPELTIGAHIHNIYQPKINEGEKERLPTVMVAGAGYKAATNVFITAEVQKDLHNPGVWKAGVEYEPHPKAIFRTGFNLKPSAGFIGFGLRPKKFLLDYSYAYYMTIGAKHQATVGYRFKKSKK